MSGLLKRLLLVVRRNPTKQCRTRWVAMQKDVPNPTYSLFWYTPESI